MSRFIIFFLLFIVIFLGGMIVGINQHSEETELLIDDEVEVIEEIEIDQTLYMNEEGNHKLFTQKFAFISERVISGFYEVLVSILYNIAKIFTG